MNFKEVYNSANDEIQGDRMLIEEIFKKADKKPVFKPVYPMACVAAAAAIVIAVSVYPKNDITPNQNINIVSHKESENIQKDVTKELANEIVEEKSITPPSAKGELPVEEKTKSAVETSDLMNDGIMVASIDDSELQENVSGYARASSSEAENEEPFEFEGKTAKQYCEYIGADIVQKALLPVEMSFEEFLGATIKKDAQTGEIISDEAEFCANDENRYLTISTSKILSIAEEKLNDETLIKSDINGIRAIIENDGTTFHVYFKFNDVNYKISSTGLSEEEINTLILSLCKN